MKERSSGETYSKSYIAIPILESPLFKWVQSINGNKKFYHITILFLGALNDKTLPEVKDIMSYLPKTENHLPIIPEKLDFIGANRDTFVLKIRNTDELSEIREMLEERLPKNEFSGQPFVPHITIKAAKRGDFCKYERDKLLDINDRSKTLESFTANTIGLYYRTEEGATALLFSKKI